MAIDREKVFAEFDGMDEAEVRMGAADGYGWPRPRRVLAKQWVVKKDTEAAKDSLKLATRANWIAWSSLIVAVLSFALALWVESPRV